MRLKQGAAERAWQSIERYGCLLRTSEAANRLPRIRRRLTHHRPAVQIGAAAGRRVASSSAIEPNPGEEGSVQLPLPATLPLLLPVVAAGYHWARCKIFLRIAGWVWGPEDSRASPGELWLGMAPSPSPRSRQAVRETATPVNVSSDEVLPKFLRGDTLQLARGDAAVITFLRQAPGARQPAPSGQEPQD